MNFRALLFRISHFFNSLKWSPLNAIRLVFVITASTYLQGSHAVANNTQGHGLEERCRRILSTDSKRVDFGKLLTDDFRRLGFDFDREMAEVGILAQGEPSLNSIVSELMEFIQPPFAPGIHLRDFISATERGIGFVKLPKKLRELVDGKRWSWSRSNRHLAKALKEQTERELNEREAFFERSAHRITVWLKVYLALRTEGFERPLAMSRIGHFSGLFNGYIQADISVVEKLKEEAEVLLSTIQRETPQH